MVRVHHAAAAAGHRVLMSDTWDSFTKAEPPLPPPASTPAPPPPPPAAAPAAAALLARGALAALVL